MARQGGGFGRENARILVCFAPGRERGQVKSIRQIKIESQAAPDACCSTFSFYPFRQSRAHRFDNLGKGGKWSRRHEGSTRVGVSAQPIADRGGLFARHAA